MKKRIRTILPCILILTLALSVLAFGATASAGGEEREPVELNWLIANLGPNPADAPEVWAAVNEKLQDYLPGTTLNITCVPFAEYDQRWMLEAASGATWDLAWFGWMFNLATEVNNGALMPLNDLVAQYAPNLYDELAPFMFDCNTIDGNLYLIPSNQIAATPATGIRFPADLADKYLDRTALDAGIQAWADSDRLYPPAQLLDVIEDYAQKCMDAGELQLGINADYFRVYMGAWNYWFDVRMGKNGSSAFCKANDESARVYNYADFADEALEHFERMRSWYEKGFIRKDALTVEDWEVDIKYYPDGNGYVTWAHNYDKYMESIDSVHYEFPITVIQALQPKAPTMPNPTNTSHAVMSGAKNPERAVEFLGFLNTEAGKEIYNMLVYGIEGKHWAFTDKDAGIIETFGYSGQVTADDPYGIPKWVVGNTYYAYAQQDVDPEYDKYMCGEFNMSAMPMPLSGFVFNNENVMAEFAAWNQINEEYLKGLYFGTFSDVPKAYSDYLAALDAAGCRNIAAEAQKQVDAFLTAK